MDYCANMGVAAVLKIVGANEVIKVPMRLRSAMQKIWICITAKTQSNVKISKEWRNLNELKAEDDSGRSIVTEIIALIHKVYNTDKYLKKEWTRIAELEGSIKTLAESLRSQKALLAELYCLSFEISSEDQVR